MTGWTSHEENEQDYIYPPNGWVERQTGETMPDRKANTVIEGTLEIDHANGVAYFRNMEGNTVLRVTHLTTPTPRGVGIDLTSIAQLTAYTPLPRHDRRSDLQKEADQAKELKLSGWNAPAESSCPTCHKIHDGRDYYHAKDGSPLLAGHEYIITTRDSNQRYPREWRMGLVGEGLQGLVFTARGPDQSWAPPYGGTVNVSLTALESAKEVERDEAERYTQRRKAS
jgi:hypothetical protein